MKALATVISPSVTINWEVYMPVMVNSDGKRD
jgi:hypothetical protein